MASDAHRAILATMSPRMRLVLEALLRGSSEKEIAGELAMNRNTLHSYVKDIYRRLDVHTRAELLVALLAPPHVPAPFEVVNVDAAAGASSSVPEDPRRGGDGQATGKTAGPDAR